MSRAVYLKRPIVEEQLVSWLAPACGCMEQLFYLSVASHEQSTGYAFFDNLLVFGQHIGGHFSSQKLVCYSPKEVTAVNTKVVETDLSTVVTNH